MFKNSIKMGRGALFNLLSTTHTEKRAKKTSEFDKELCAGSTQSGLDKRYYVLKNQHQ